VLNHPVVTVAPGKAEDGPKRPRDFVATNPFTVRGSSGESLYELSRLSKAVDLKPSEDLHLSVANHFNKVLTPRLTVPEPLVSLARLSTLCSRTPP
jgi:hypothetical protein